MTKPLTYSEAQAAFERALTAWTVALFNCSEDGTRAQAEVRSAASAMVRAAHRDNIEPCQKCRRDSPPEEGRPRIVCLCGSARFSKAFRDANLTETLAGRIVLSIGCDFKSDQGLKLGDETKIALDVLHKRKIDLADEILVLNVGGYIGESTRSEIEHARATGKYVRWLESPPEGGRT